MASEFEKYAVKHLGMSSARLDSYARVYSGYINPTIIEERQLNVASMDVFSRLMMDRIIFLGVGIDNDVANIVQAQLLFLESTDSSSDIQIYVNSPGGMVYAGLGIYDLNGSCAAGRRSEGQALGVASFQSADPSADGRC